MYEYEVLVGSPTLFRWAQARGLFSLKKLGGAQPVECVRSSSFQEIGDSDYDNFVRMGFDSGEMLYLAQALDRHTVHFIEVMTKESTSSILWDGEETEVGTSHEVEEGDKVQGMVREGRHRKLQCSIAACQLVKLWL